MSDPSKDGIAVFGLGLIGASLAAACKKQYPGRHVVGVDIDSETVRTALERGWVDEGHVAGDDSIGRSVCDTCGLAVIATPASCASDYFELLDSSGFSGIITDTASTKRMVCRDACDILTRPERFIPGHPMAGSEKNGIDGARIDLFEGAHWILCPDEHTAGDDFSFLHELLTGLGARVVSLPREDHDQVVAVVSHVPHIVASSLVEMARRHADDQQSVFRLAAGGFKDSTRIAAGSPELWCGIAFDNADALNDGIQEMREILDSFSDALERGDRKGLTELLDVSARIRRSLPVSWVPSTDDLLEVRIPMENRTGVVAEVTTVASKVGCNIQSIEIDHLTADSAVLSMILTDEGDVGKLSTELLKAGFNISFSPLSAKEHSHVE